MLPVFLRNNWGMKNEIKAPQQKLAERDSLVALVEVLTNIDRRENIIDMGRLKNETKN